MPPLTSLLTLASGSLFGVVIMIFFAMIGYLMNTFGYSVIAFIIAFFLGERFELALSQSLSIIDGDPAFLLTRPVAIGLLVLALASVYWFGFRPMHTKRNRAGGEKTVQ